MNREVLGELSDWALDCLLDNNEKKYKKIMRVYHKMFDTQWKHSSWDERRRCEIK